MKVFVDTNVFVASLTDEPGRGYAATEFLSQDHEFCTTVFNVMELRTVLTKKKQIEQSEAEEILEDITETVDIYFPEVEDLADAYELQIDTLLYPLDCLIFVTALIADGTLVTFDAELVENGAQSPDDFL